MSVTRKHTASSRENSHPVAPVALSVCVLEKANLPDTWRGPTLRPRGPPLSQHLGRGGRDHPTVSPRNHVTVSSL